jgi:1-pyrroline-4-hydroxy-2-carboxylate deaminase
MPMKIDWTGVFPAVTTQFREDQSLDLEATARHIESQIASGVQGIIALGSLGENTALDPAEKRRVLELAVKTAAGRVPVLSGVAESSTAAACRFVADLEKLGADGYMLMPAMVYKTFPEETVAYYRAVARSSGLPVLIYNNPIAYGVDLTPELLDQLAGEARFAAIKESSGDVRRITDIQNRLGDRYALFCGVDDLILESLFLGARGWVAGLGNAFPHENQVLFRLAMAGEWARARQIYRWYMPLLHLDTHGKFVQYIKLAMQETGEGQEWVRAPRLPLAGPERDRVLAVTRMGLASRPVVSWKV